MQFTLPGFDYFSNSKKVDNENPKKCAPGSPYSGSAGTDPRKGFLSVRTFNYRVHMYKDMENVTSLIAESWVSPPYSAKSEPQMEGYEKQVFDGVEASLPLIEEWLSARYSQLMGEE